MVSGEIRSGGAFQNREGNSEGHHKSKGGQNRGQIRLGDRHRVSKHMGLSEQWKEELRVGAACLQLQLPVDLSGVVTAR